MLEVASVLTLLLLALGLAVQPWSVLAAVLLVSSKRGVAKEIGYVAGWLLALSVVMVLSVALYPEVPKSSSSSAVIDWLVIAAGVALGGWLFVRWRRPARSGSAGQPRWMGRVDSMSPVAAFVLGGFLPNYVLVVAAASQMLQAGLSQSRMVVVGLAFVVVASLGVAAPLLVLVVRRQQAPRIYQGWRTWLVSNAQLVGYGVGAVLALVLVIKGVFGLVS